MALLNRLFGSRKRPFARSQDNVSEKLFTFANEQVRVIVFRECDFRGRKLLFDSKTVQKMALVDGPPEHEAKKYVEVSNGHGYTYTKPSDDVARLGEMIFGSVAMSFRGTTYKIHSVPFPAQLVCSQVFPSPKNPAKLRRSAPSHFHTGSNIEHSVRLEDSGASSATSGSDQSVLSGASDTVLVCKRQQSVPLDVPVNFSLVSSSGYGEEHSYSSISSGPQSIPVDLSQGVHSGDSLSRRWPWNNTTTSASMDPSTGSLPGSVSTDESFHKVRSSKIGLAVLVELTDGEEEKLEQFLMEHAALIEMLMWRVRRSVEGAYIRHGTFVSVMYGISAQTSRWLVDLLNGARTLVQSWHSHFPNCDSLFSIIKKSPSISFLGHLTDGSPKRTLRSEDRDAVRFSALTGGSGLFSSFQESGGEFSFVNLSRFLKSDHGQGIKKEKGILLAEKFVNEFCELLESMDVKHTNFFISTLVTAVLTHHLGWVNTVLPVALKPNRTQSSNPYWSQLTELYGAIGYPVKMSRTVVSGSNKSDLVPKILNALKYFIRCTDVSRHCQTRMGIDWENENADAICSAHSCIPKENYKKYEDHLREIEAFTKAENEQQVLKLKMPNAESFIKPNRKLELTKTHTCLSKLCEGQEKHTEILDRVTTMGLQAINPGDKIDVTCSFLKNIKQEEQQLVDISEAKQQIERVFSPKKNNLENTKILKSSKSLLKIIPVVEEIETVLIENNNVVFVLGENEELVGIKRETTPTKPVKDVCCGSEKLVKEKSQFFTTPVQEETIAKPSVSFNKSNKSLALIDDSVSDVSIPSKSITSLSTLKKSKSQIFDNPQKTLFTSLETLDVDTLPSNLCEDLQLLDPIVHEKSSSHKFSNPQPEICWKFEIANENRAPPVVSPPELCENQPEETKSKSELDLPTMSRKHKSVKLKRFKSKENKNAETYSTEKFEFETTPTEMHKSSSAEVLNLQNYPPEESDLQKQSQSETFVEFYKSAAPDIYEDLDTSPFKDSDFTKCSGAACIKPSTSFTEKQPSSSKIQRAMSEPPHVPTPIPCTSTKYKYTGVKFNFQQYPQIVENYMKNKNIEMSNMQFSEKKLDFLWESTYDLSRCEGAGGNYEEGEALTTPSNASELEFTSEFFVDKVEGRKAEEVLESPCRRLEFTRNVVPNTVIKEPNPYEHAKLLKDAKNRRISEERTFSNLKVVELPMPRSQDVESRFPPIDYTNSLIRDLEDHYVSDMVLQGTSAPKCEWEPQLKQDLVLSTQHAFSNQQVEESIAIVANTDTWEVQLMSSHTYVIDRSAAGVPVGMSQLVANMLETLLHMWRLHTPAEYCLMHIEQQLQEFCLRSKALAQLLLDTDFCSMEILTSTLRLEVNDVPLLMAIASTHTPQVTQKYGLSFQ